MPAGDGTGPRGMGPRTGRGAGYCAGNDAPGYANPGPGRGFGMSWGRGRGWGVGRGGGRGWRNTYCATGLPGWTRYGARPTPEQETEFLRTQAERLKDELDSISQRIEELEKGKKK